MEEENERRKEKERRICKKRWTQLVGGLKKE
jgi:hypothetical protein